jgi:glycosyltransferase involved in cell wall biosynthesis
VEHQTSEQPVLSIVVPVYNQESTISSCLKSLLSQTLSSLEIIVIDGNSTDDTASVVGSFTDDRLRLISESDSGVYDAMNKGLEKASGTWIYFIGADDKLSGPDILNNLLDSPGADIDLIVGKVKNVNREHPKVPEIHVGSFDKRMKFRNTVHHQGVVYRRDVIKDIGYDSALAILGDYDLNIKLLNSGAKAKISELVIAECDARGLSKNFGRDLYREELKIKRRNLQGMDRWVQEIWVWMKFLFKNT